MFFTVLIYPEPFPVPTVIPTGLLLVSSFWDEFTVHETCRSACYLPVWGKGCTLCCFSHVGVSFSVRTKVFRDCRVQNLHIAASVGFLSPVGLFIGALIL